MKKISLLLAASMLFLVACSHSNVSKVKPLDLKNDASTTVFLTLKLSPDSDFFTERTLKVSMYRYNPMIADVPATLVDKKCFRLVLIKGISLFLLRQTG